STIGRSEGLLGGSCLRLIDRLLRKERNFCYRGSIFVSRLRGCKRILEEVYARPQCAPQLGRSGESLCCEPLDWNWAAGRRRGGDADFLASEELSRPGPGMGPWNGVVGAFPLGRYLYPGRRASRAGLADHAGRGVSFRSRAWDGYCFA